MTPERRRFVDDIAALYVPWAMPQISGRMLGYLLLCPEPVSLDDIAADLELSKSSASITTRLLEKHGLAIRHSVPGSKRVLYAASTNVGGLLLEKAALLGATGRMLQSRCPDVATGKVEERFQKMANIYLAMRDVIEKAVHQLDTSEN